MNILAIILSITAFVCAFIPVYGMIISILFTIVSVVLAVITSKDNKYKEGSVIAVTLSIFAILVCMVVNIVYFVNANKDKKNLDGDPISAIQTYNLNEGVISCEKFEIKINDITDSEDNVKVELSVTSKIDGFKFSVFDFALSDGSSNNYVVASYTLDLPSIDYNLNTNEKEDLTLVFSHKKFDTNNFIVFNNSENGVKILI